MATLKYTSLPLLKFIIYFTLPFIFLVSCLDAANKAVDEGHHFHTVEISSLLPASVCSSSISTKGSSKKQSTLEVFHKHGPCSKLGQSKSTSAPTLAEVLSHDQSRVNSIQARLAPKSSTDNINDKKVMLPAQPGGSLGGGNYAVKVGLGNPAKYVSLVFDTGSDLTWTQCQPCAGSCYQQQEPIFNPSESTSYSNITCTSNLCSQLTSATSNTPRCSTTTCVYRIQYGDGSITEGFFSKDMLIISATDIFPNFLFGCGQNNNGLFGNTAGLLGLGRDPLSLVSQTSQKYGKYFSYCLPSTSSSTGYLTLGESGVSANTKFTPFASSQSTSFYLIDILSISVGNRQLAISQSVFSSGGTAIDSGTVITRLPPTAYKSMSTEFQAQMTMYTKVPAPASSIFDTCYDFSSYTSVSIPTISFTFGGNVEVDLDPSGILYPIGASRFCLAFAGNRADTSMGIFGNTQQKTLQVVYDVAGGKLGFASAGC